MRLAFIILLFCLQAASAQDNEHPFSTVEFSGGILINSNRNLLHQYWEPGKGYFISAGTPFYFGDIEIGMLSIPYKKLSDDVPDFRNYFFFMGLSRDISLPLNISITGGVRFGSNLFKFSDDSLSEYDAIESELGFDLYTSGKIRVFEGLHIKMNADYLGILTKRPIRLFFLSAGVGYEFNTPVWLKEFLR